jgi:hypothetical protein
MQREKWYALRTRNVKASKEKIVEDGSLDEGLALDPHGPQRCTNDLEKEVGKVSMSGDRKKDYSDDGKKI